MQYSRNELDFKRGTFRAKGDVLEIYPSSQSESAIRVEFWGDEIEKIHEINPLTGKSIGLRSHVLIPPASQYVTSKEKLEKAIVTIEEELKERVAYFKSQNKLIEAQRIEERTNFDIEMMKETGFCQGIENYSRHISGRPAGSPPYTLFLRWHVRGNLSKNCRKDWRQNWVNAEKGCGAEGIPSLNRA